MKKYGVGVLGCGRVWSYHRLAFEHSDRLECTRVYDPIGERAETAAKLTGARPMASAEAVCNADDVDIVAVLTPAYTHADLVEMAARAGKHLMLEKPMANDLADAGRIVKAIAAAGVKCFHPTLRALGSDLFDKLRDLTRADGLLGPVRYGSFYVLGAPFDWASWFADKTRCVPMAEYGSHVLDTFAALTGQDPVSVDAHFPESCPALVANERSTVDVEFGDGRCMTMSIAWVLDPVWKDGTQEFHLVCDRGVITHNWFSAKWHWAEGQGEYSSSRTATQGERWEHYLALLEAIEGGTGVSPNERDGYRYVRIVDAALRSRRTGKTVLLGNDYTSGEQA